MLTLLALLGATAVFAVVPTLARANLNIYQCAWGFLAPRECVGDAWVRGNPNPNGAYGEGDFVPFRAVFRPGGTPEIHRGNTYRMYIGYDAVRDTRHTYDYLGTYNASGAGRPPIVPCSGAPDVDESACDHPGTPTSTTEIPVDTRSTNLHGSPVPPHPVGHFAAWASSSCPRRSSHVRTAAGKPSSPRVPR